MLDIIFQTGSLLVAISLDTAWSRYYWFWFFAEQVVLVLVVLIIW